MSATVGGELREVVAKRATVVRVSQSHRQPLPQRGEVSATLTATLILSSIVSPSLYSALSFSFYIMASKVSLIYTTIGDACVCVCVCVCLQNWTNFCPYALISTPNVP